MTRFIVYSHVNQENRKQYVGVTSFTVEKRWAEHVRSAIQQSETAFHRAIRKYGFDCWDHVTLEEFATLDEALQGERRWIVELGTHVSLNNGYNQTLGGDGAFGLVHSDETKLKISVANSGANSPGFGKPGPNLGKTFSLETRRKMSEAHLGKKRSRDSLAKQSKTLTGRHHSKERNENISRSKTKYRVEQLTLDGTTIQVFQSFRDACNAVKVTSRTSIMNCCNGLTSQAYGFKWKLHNV